MSPTVPLRLWRWPAWVGLGLPLAVFLALAWFAHPFCDDYSFANSGVIRGLWGAEQAWYLGWTGRYTGIAVQLLFPRCFDLVQNYTLVPLALMAGLWASFAGVAAAGNRALGRPLGRRQALAAATIFTVLYFALMPSPAEGLYWLAGAGSYTVPLIAAGGMLACGLAITRETAGRVQAIAGPVAAALGFVAAGGNESYLAPLGLLLLAATVIAFRRRHASRWVWAAALLGFSAGAALVVLAPGNSTRLDHFQKSPWRALGNTVPRLLLWAVGLPLAVGVTLLAAPALQELAGRLPWTRTLTRRHLYAVIAATGTLVALTVAPAVGLGLVPPPRVLNGAYLFFLAGGFAAAFVAVALRHNRAQAPLPGPRLLKWGYGLLLLGLCVTSNVPLAVYDLAGRARDYDQQLQARYAALRRDPQPDKTGCPLNELTTLPRTIRPGNSRDDRDALPHVRCYFALQASRNVTR